MIGERIRHWTGSIENPHSVASRMRMRRWQRLLAVFPDLPEMAVLDLGGTYEGWFSSPVRPKRVVVLNLLVPPSPDPSWLQGAAGDACALPPELKRAHFDLVYSNSLIEHVGGPERRKAFADEVASFDVAHWVQTPNRHFPIEPHWLFPAFQYLPEGAQAIVSRHWPVGHVRSPKTPKDAALRDVREVRLLARREFAALFPTSEIIEERAFGLVKSFVAIKRTRGLQRAR